MELITQPYEALDDPQLAPEAADTQALMLAESAKILTCTTPTEAQAVSTAARSLQTHIKSVQEMGLKLRRPVTEWAKLVKTIEDSYLAPLLAEKKRFERLVDDWTASERRRVAREEAARQAEIQRLDRERRELERKAQEEAERVARANREAEDRARQAEALISNKRQLAAAMKAEEARKIEAARQQAIADAAQEEARKASEAAQAAIRQAPPTQQKIKGMATKRTMAYEVTDLKALYAARPELVTLELNKAAVRAILVPNVLPESDAKDLSVPGIVTWWQDQTSTRAN